MTENLLWKAGVVVPTGQLVLAQDILETLLSGSSAPTISSFRLDGGERWSIEAFVADRPERQDIAIALGQTGIEGSDITVEPVPDEDWVTLSRKSMKPVDAGRFHIYPQHRADDVPPGRVAIMIDPGQAFGTGAHETTRGCLLALDAIARERPMQRPLDVGCGSGVLAIAMARLWPVPVLASDIDPVACEVTVENAELNGVAETISAIAAEGMEHPRINDMGPFDIITANILARPLCGLAPGIASRLAPQGLVVLSGLLAEQEPEVLSAYERQGLRLTRRFELNGWNTLVLKRD
ncbi:MAG: 50S ribosomal protein L11 methyltransferase [Sphingomonadales bacterium]